MNCKTRREKITEAWEEFKRFVKIITISVVCIAIFGIALGFGLTMKENKELRTKIETMEKQNNDRAEESKTTTYTVVVDEVTGRVIYADF